jgi:hypothetical protein
MKIKKITSQHRRDFSADMECEFCNSVSTLSSGYDDSFYHSNVIPNMVCKKCDKSTITGKGEIDKRATRYPEGFQI